MIDDIQPSEDAVAHFSDTADHYASKHYDDAVRSFMTVRQVRVLELIDGLDLPDGAEALDAGCGPGYLVEQLASRGFKVSALDGAEGMLRKARARLEATECPFAVDFRQGDIERLPYEDERFDLVLSTGVIEYLATDERALGEMHRVLRPGGHLVLPVTNRWATTLWLDGGVELLKRQRWFRTPVNALLGRLGRPPVLPRHFDVRRHRPARFRSALEKAGFRILDDVYFYFLPWPRPLDQLLPGASAAIGSRMERLGRSRLGLVAEGYLTLSVKPG